MTQSSQNRKVEDLQLDDKNANRGTIRGRAMLSDSFENYGAGRSILIDKNGKVIAGNKSLEAYAEAGGEEVVVIPTDGKQLVAVQRTDLDLDKDKQARELAVLDNRTAEIGLSWNVEALQQLSTEGVNLLAAFDQPELDHLTAISEQAAANALQLNAPPADFPEYNENIKTEYRCPKCSYCWSGKPN